MFLNAPYDFLFFKDPYIVQILRSKLGGPVYYLPECYAPRVLSPEFAPEPPSKGQGVDICTAGNLYSYRVAFFRNLTDYDVRHLGYAPPRCG